MMITVYSVQRIRMCARNVLRDTGWTQAIVLLVRMPIAYNALMTSMLAHLVALGILRVLGTAG